MMQWLTRSCLVLCGLQIALSAARPAMAFTLTDHAVKALIRPCAKIDEFEAESCPGVPPAAVRQEARAANGKAVMLTTNGPTLRFSRRLERSTYAVWCIARSAGRPSRYREPEYVHLQVTRRPDGPTRQWRMRINYMRSMYQDVAHLYVDVNEPGHYDFEFSLGHGSTFDLLVDRLELRDVLAGTFKKGYKTASTLYPTHPHSRSTSAADAFSQAEANRRAREIAAGLPPHNAILASGGMPKKGYYQEFGLRDAPLAEPNAGRWMWRLKGDLEKPWRFSGPTLPVEDELDSMLAKSTDGEGIPGLAAPVSARSFGTPPASDPQINWATADLGARGEYNAEDYAAFRKAGGRWPDDGGGFFIPRAEMNLDGNRYFNWMARAFKERITAFRSRIGELADDYYRTGDPQTGFRAALMLAFFADQFPSLDYTVQSTMETTWGNSPFNCFAGNRAGGFGKIDYSGWAGKQHVPLVHAYDKLFPVIKDNPLLAEAIGQVIPWVKTPQDVVELIDVKLVQHLYDVANRGLVRFSPGMRCDPTVAIVQGNNEAGRTMLNAIVNESTYQFPGLLDGLVCRHSRDATSFIGSMFYAKGPALAAGAAVASITDYARQVGLDSFDLTTPRRSTILRQSAQWLIEPYATGIHIPGVGDVSGPYGYPCMVVGDASTVQPMLLAAWRRYRDPRFAWMLAHVYGLAVGVSSDVRAEVERAASEVDADPRVNQASRVLGGFGVTILEGNGDNPDFRKRTGLVLRTGYGSGHGHNDQLNLEMFAHGIVALPEFGGRPGYGNPPTGAPTSHCLATVDGGVSTSGRTTLLARAPGWVSAEGIGGNVHRFVSLIEAGPDNAYVFDVARATGGRRRTYWVHGNQTDVVDEGSLRAKTDALVLGGDSSGIGDDLLAELAAEEEPGFKWNHYVFSHSLKRGSKTVEDETYQAVWPLDRDMQAKTLARVEHRYRFPDGKAPENLSKPLSRRVFTRLILLRSHARRVRTVTATSEQVGYRIVCAGISEQRPENEMSVFPALIESFAGEPVIKDFAALPVSPSANGNGVAARVRLADGRRDVVYQSDDPGIACRVGEDGVMRATAKAAFVSVDDDGPRACALAGGTEVAGAGMRLKVRSPVYEATIVAVDFLANTVTLDRELPAGLLADSYFLLGRGEESFRVRHAVVRDGGTVLKLDKTPETYRAPVFLVHDGNEIVAPIEPESRQETGWLTDETRQGGWPVEGVAIGAFRWMGTSFRGGARMGAPIMWDDIPDADGDGLRTLLLGPNDQWKEAMRVHVLAVDESLRVFAFKPLNRPDGYAGTRSYARGPIHNEAGTFIGTTVIPGKMGSFRLAAETALTREDFEDVNGDGQARFHVYHFGPGAPARLATYAGVERQSDGSWEVESNTPVTVTLPGAGVSTSTDGKTWHALTARAVNGTVEVELSERELKNGRCHLRVGKP